jgi:hypothetical protein
VAAELLSGPLGGFTAERNARAKAARADGDRDLAGRIGALPKPSVSAWLVDLLAREAPDDLQRVLDLGEALQQAQEDADRARLRELAAERRSLLSEVARSAASRAEAAGQRVGDAVLEEVQQTLQAALSSPAAAAAVRTGRLVRALDADGIEPVDLDGAVAGGAPSSRPPGRGSARRGSARRDGNGPVDAEHEAAARREAEERRRRLTAAQDRAEEAAARARAAAATAEDRQRDAADLRKRVEELRTRLQAAEQAQGDAESASAAAREEAEDAAAEVDRIASDG